jgi:GTP-binding protein YchF
MRAALIGLPQSGKSTLYVAVTGRQVAAGEMPHEHFASVTLPDERVDFLAALYKAKKVAYAAVEFMDVPGFSLADRHGTDEFKRHLPAIRQADVLVGVVRDFKNTAVPPYRNRVDPQADLAELWEEFVFADLEAVTNRIERLDKSLKKPSKTHDSEKHELHLMEKCRAALEKMQPVSAALASEEEHKATASFAFLTEKSWVVVYNVDEGRTLAVPPAKPEQAQAALALCAETEAEIAQLEEADRAAFLRDFGVTEPARDRLLRSCFEALGLITFFTVNENEAHARTIPRGTTALEAAGGIHADLARGFIRAETVAYRDLRAAGDLKSAKAAGKVRQEGKTYVVQDGDVILIKFNV